MALRAPRMDAYRGVTRPGFEKFRRGPDETAERSLSAEAPRRPFVVGRERVLDDAGTHFLHRDALEFVRGLGKPVTLEPGQCASAELLGTLRRHVDKKKPAGDRCGSFNLGDVSGNAVLLILLNHGL
jgi:hypothetical protein